MIYQWLLYCALLLFAMVHSIGGFLFGAFSRMQQADTVVVYAYPWGSVRRLQRLKFFLMFGINSSVDYIFVVENQTEAPFPSTHNVEVVRIAASNSDYATWKVGLDVMRQKGRQHRYRHYVFLTAVVSGPYQTDWLSTMTSMLSDSVRAVGLTYHCALGHLVLPRMAWATDHIGLRVLKAAGTFLKGGGGGDAAKEAQTAAALYGQGYRVSSLQAQRSGWPPPASAEGCSAGADPWHGNASGAPLTPRTYPFVKATAFPYVRVLLVAYSLDAQPEAQQLLRLGSLLQRAGGLVEAAVGATGSLASELQRRGIPTHVFGVTPEHVIPLVRDLYTALRYHVVVWNTRHFMAEDAAAATPMATTILWLHAPIPEPPPVPGVSAALHFTYLWAPGDVVEQCCRLLHPSRLQPPSFIPWSGGLPADDDDEDVPRDAMSRIAVDALEAVRAGTLRLSFPGPAAPGQCPYKAAPARLAILVHLAWTEPIRVVQVMQALSAQGVEAHIWVSYLDPAHTAQLATWGWHYPPVKLVPVMVKNRGMDVGPFLLLLWHVRRCGYGYEYVLKFHFKSGGGEWQDRMWEFISRPVVVRAAMRYLDAAPGAAALVPAGTVNNRGDKQFMANNGAHFAGLSETLGLPPLRSFTAGTVFLTRLRLLLRYIRTDAQLQQVYADLSDPGGLDWRWYARVALGDERLPRAQALEHWWAWGRHDGTGGHPYNSRKHAFQRDGMAEHAWERAFGAMFNGSLKEFGEAAALVADLEDREKLRQH